MKSIFKKLVIVIFVLLLYSCKPAIVANYIVNFDINGETIDFIALGGNQSAAITSTGRVFTWGYNYFGQLGDGTTTNRTTPTEITENFDLSASERIISIAVGGEHSAAITSTGRLFTWGDNDKGQLGDGTTTNKTTPTEITENFDFNASETIIRIELGGFYSAALTSTGRVFTWGLNLYGQLGDGTTTNKTIPTEITNQFNLTSSETIISIKLGLAHSAALTSTGRLFTWGDNDKGQLGYEKLGTWTILHWDSPIEITSNFVFYAGETITSINLGQDQSSVITSNGRVFMWGLNDYGQLGDGTKIDKPIPTEITTRFSLGESETIINVELENNHSAALTSWGRVFTWGSNFWAELGDGTKIDKPIPTDITSYFKLSSSETILSVKLGNQHSAAVTSRGRLFTWGMNIEGQLGNGTTE